VRSAEFERIARAMIGNGYSPLPIAHGEKYPGRLDAAGCPQNLSGWQRWCREQPTDAAIDSWLRMIGDRETGVGVACGRNLIVVDIDNGACMNAVMDSLPVASVSKRGKKGVSLLYRGDTTTIRTKHFNAVGGGALVDLLSTGTQSCLPPSRHPDGMFYEWVSEDTLIDTPLDHLTELPNDAVDRLSNALARFGYDPTAERPTTPRAPTPTTARSATGASNLWRETNDRALEHFDCWVPPLELYKCRPKPGGFEAVATWRNSSTNRPQWQRKRNLSFHRDGIVDFGTGETYTATDIVMRRRRCDKFAASNWLLEHLPQQEPLINDRNSQAHRATVLRPRQ